MMILITSVKVLVTLCVPDDCGFLRHHDNDSDRGGRCRSHGQDVRRPHGAGPNDAMASSFHLCAGLHDTGKLFEEFSTQFTGFLAF